MDGGTREDSNGQAGGAVGPASDPIGWLALKTADGRVHPVALLKSQNVIGRSTNCDVRIAIPSVGRRHCEIAQEGAMLAIRALASKPTLCNGREITQHILAEGDVLTIGPVELAFYRSEAAMQSSKPRMSDMSAADPPIVHVQSTAVTPNRVRE